MSSAKSKPTLKDKEAASELPVTLDVNGDDAFSIDPALRAELESKGLAHRWINARKFKDNYGYDARRWVPYKRESKMPGGYESFGYADPEGFIRRGDLILAAQPIAIAEARKAKIAARTAALAGHNKQAAADLKKTMKEAGLNAKVHEGFDENE